MSDQPSEREISPERSPWSRPSVLLSAAFLLALLLLGILVTATGAGRHTTARPTPPSAAPSTEPAPAPSSNASVSGCSLPRVDQSVPVERPAAGAVGDGRRDAGPAEPATVRAAALERAVEHVLRARSLGRAAGGDEPVGGGNGGARERAVRSGSRSARRTISAATRSSTRAGRSSSPATATTPTRDLTLRWRSCSAGPEGKLLAVVTTMVWDDGDWKYLFPTGGAPAMQVIADLTGYVQWSSF